MVVFILGSESDKPFVEKITKHLDGFGVEYEINVASAHKVPEKVVDIIEKYNAKEEPTVYITVAGRSNGLSGVTAGSAIHPVIACPPFASKEDFIININSTLQMPSDTPVLTVVDPQNAALCAVKILALTDPALKERVTTHIKSVKDKF